MSAPVAPETVTPPEPEAPDPFQSAFASFSSTETPLAGEPAPDVPTVTSAPDAVVEPAPVETPPAPVADALAAAAAVPGAPAAPDVDQIMAGLSRIVDAAKTPTPAPAPAAPAAPEAEPEPYTAEERTELQNFVKEWPEQASVLPLIFREQNRMVVNHVFAEMRKQFEAEVAPLRAVVQEILLKDHQQQLAEDLPDYDTIDPKAVIDWADTQPAYLRNVYRQVLESGTAPEVVDVVNRFRADTGAAPAAPATPAPVRAAPAAPAAVKVTEPPRAVKQAAAALAPVGSQRSTPSATIDKNDFAGAFETFKTIPV